MNAVTDNNIAKEMARDQKNAVKASTDAFIAGSNATRRAAGFDPDSDKSISLGAITSDALDLVDVNMTRQRVDDIARSSLRAAAGITQDAPAPVDDKQARRINLINFARKHLDPERVFQQLCAGVASQKIGANDGLWLAQRISNAACTLAVREYVRRKQESGVIAGIDLHKDDLGVWDGQEATNIAEMARDNRQTSNIFSTCDDPDTVEGTFRDWYNEIEICLSALSNASTTRDGSILQYGQHSRWVEGVGGWSQIIEDFDDRISAALTVANDRSTATAVASNDDPWAKFN